MTYEDLRRLSKDIKISNAKGIRACWVYLSELGFSIPDLADALQVTVEEMRDIFDGSRPLGHLNHDRMQQMITAGIWFHAFRIGQGWSREPLTLANIPFDCALVWHALPRPLRDSYDLYKKQAEASSHDHDRNI